MVRHQIEYILENWCANKCRDARRGLKTISSDQHGQRGKLIEKIGEDLKKKDLDRKMRESYEEPSGHRILVIQILL